MLLAPLVLVSYNHILSRWLHNHHVLAIVDLLHHHGPLSRMILGCRPSIVVNIDLYLLNAQVKDFGILKQLLIVAHSSPWIGLAASQPSLILFWHPAEAESHSIIRLLIISMLLHRRSSKRSVHSLIFQVMIAPYRVHTLMALLLHLCLLGSHKYELVRLKGW